MPRLKPLLTFMYLQPRHSPCPEQHYPRCESQRNPAPRRLDAATLHRARQFPCRQSCTIETQDALSMWMKGMKMLESPQGTFISVARDLPIH